MAGQQITCSWNELLRADTDGRRTIDLLRACLMANAKRREADEFAPVGFTEKIFKSLEELVSAAYIGAVEATKNGDLPAPVAAMRGANRTLCKMYRREKRTPSAVTLSFDDETTAGFIEARACHPKQKTPETVIAFADLLDIAQNHAGKGDAARRVQFVKCLFNGMRRVDATQISDINRYARGALETQISRYFTCSG